MEKEPIMEAVDADFVLELVRKVISEVIDFSPQDQNRFMNVLKNRHHEYWSNRAMELDSKLVEVREQSSIALGHSEQVPVTQKSPY